MSKAVWNVFHFIKWNNIKKTNPTENIYKLQKKVYNNVHFQKILY